MVAETTPFDEPVVSYYRGSAQLAVLVRKVSSCLVDTLIDLGLKNSVYRDDAESDAWLYYVGVFVSGTLGIVGSAVDGMEQTVLVDIYREAIRLAPEQIDFTLASAEVPPPRLLNAKADQLVGEAIVKIVQPQVGVEGPSLADAPRPSPEKKAEYQARYLAHRRKTQERVFRAQAESGYLERRVGGGEPYGAGRSPRTRREEVEDEEFAAEVDQLFEVQEGGV